MRRVPFVCVDRLRRQAVAKASDSPKVDAVPILSESSTEQAHALLQSLVAHDLGVPDLGHDLVC